MPCDESTCGELLQAVWNEFANGIGAAGDATRTALAGTIWSTMTAMSAPTSPIDQGQAIFTSPAELIQQLEYSDQPRLWGPIGSFFLSLVTFGLLPLLVWPRRWNTFAEHERQQLAAVAGFWRKRASAADAVMLDAQMNELAPQSVFTVVPILVLVFVGLLLVAQVNTGRSMDDVVQVTFGYVRHTRWMHSQNEISLHIVWVTALLIGYICHWFSVRSHATAVEGVTRVIGKIAGSGVRSDFVARSGINPIWVIIAVFMCAGQSWWGIPLVLGGALQRSYVRRTSPKVRQVLIDQLRHENQPRVNGAANAYCSTPRCGAPLRQGANFCGRCGRAV